MELNKKAEALKDLYELVLTTPMETDNEANMLNYVYEMIEDVKMELYEMIKLYSRQRYDYEGEKRAQWDCEKYSLECALDMLEEI